MGMIDTLRSVVQLRAPELDRTQRRLQRCANVEDLRSLARRALPRGVFDYIDGAAEDERTAAANVDGFARYAFRPRVMRDVSRVEVHTELAGGPASAPLVLAPTGFTRIAHPEGELAVARAAGRAGLPYVLSTLGTRSIEEVAAVSSGRLWFQVYVWKDRGLVLELLERAGAAGFEAIVITVDTPVLGRRERDVRRGFSLPPKIGLDTLVDGARHPRWSLDLVRAEPIHFANVGSRPGIDGSTAVSLSEYVAEQFDPALSWRDIDWFREHWDGRILLKGVQCAQDAATARSCGVDDIVVSNHGGRQLDRARGAIEVLSEVREAVGDECGVICDGGVRRGGDLAIARALGADAVMVGRPYLYGLAAGGEQGVDHVLELLTSELRRSMALLGVTSIEELGPELLVDRLERAIVGCVDDPSGE